MSKILIVEDEGIVAKDIQNILKTLGYTVVGISSSSEDAIKKTEEMRPDLVLMDIVLDGNADGIETAKQIRNRFNIPIIYLTAFADEKTLQRAKITEPYGYILKPFQERELQITIEMGLYKHRIEKKLKDNEQYLNTTLLSIGDAVITTDTRGIITFMNPIAEILTGCTQKDCFGKPINKIFNIVNEKTGKKVESPVTKVLREGVIVGLANHTILIARDGKRISIDDSGAPIKDEKGNIIGVVLVFRDITKRRQTEDALQESEERYRTMIEKAHDMVWTLDTQANFTFFNHQSEVITGYKFENWKGKSFAPLIHPDDIETVTRVFQQTMLGKPQQYEVRIKGKYNEIVLSVNTAPIFKDEKIIGTVSFGRDITERKHAEEELLAEKEHLAVTLRSISDGMITTDIHGKIILINKVAEKLTGWNRADAIGMFLNDVFHIINEETGKKIKNPFEKVIKNNESVNIFDNTILVARDGTERNIEDSSAPIHNKDSKIIGSVLVFRDITEKRKMEYELQKAHKLESLGILASGIAHDFNNVITGIMGNISLALIHLSPNDQIFRYLTNAEKAVNQAKDL
ncbi:MAG: PAS domain S-box protein, partial [Spirochaetes bacterium]|nr:PAS domain S-box protein [Spirochaetota bacterium]